MTMYAVTVGETSDGSSARLSPALNGSPQPGGWVLVRDRWSTPEARAALVEMYLQPTEQVAYDSLSPRRQPTWLLGRVAAKDAVRHWLDGLDISVGPRAFAVINDDNGCPHLEGLDHLVADLSLSIAHIDGCAVAFVAPGAAIGIDIEEIADRAPAFTRVAFTKVERTGRHLAGVDDRTWITAAWCAKEAFGKSLGTGLEGRPSRFETRVAGPGLLAVRDRVVRWVQLDSAIAFSAAGHSLIVAWTLIPYNVIDLDARPAHAGLTASSTGVGLTAAPVLHPLVRSEENDS